MDITNWKLINQGAEAVSNFYSDKYSQVKTKSEL